MSETIREMVLPGTYIEVRAEGLIGVSGISTGNIGVVGTAVRGPLDRAVLLGSYAEAVDAFGAYPAWDAGASAVNLSLTRTLEQLFRGGASTVYAVRIANVGGPGMRTAVWSLKERAADGTAGADVFQLTATSPGTWANDLVIFTAATATAPAELKLRLGRTEEAFTGATAGDLYDAVKVGSQLVTVTPATLAPADRAKVLHSAPRTTEGGPDGGSVTGAQVEAGLRLLEDRPVNIVAVGGLAAQAAAAAVLGHLETTENAGRERIAVLGAGADAPDGVINNDSAAGGGPRLVLVAPGLVADDAASTADDRRVRLPGPYAAALVAGRLSTLAPHVSLTNKDVAAADLTTRYTRAQQKQLLESRVLVLHQNLGFRVLKGITTDDAAFKQISVRRIVDYAKTGVRQGANPYIGRLNNPRVRAALKATLDGFLSGMVLDEMIQKYTLDVSATRRQEIEGTALVTLTLQPTFSIDFIKVIINLE